MDIFRAARIGRVYQVQEALDNGADINYQDATYGRTPLSWAVANKNQGVVRWLLREDGIDLNSKANDGRTPLSCAVAVRGNKEVVELLLGEDDIDLNSKDNDGRTPLSWAVMKGNQEVLELLLREDDIDLNSKDNDGRTPLSWAVMTGNQEVVELLIREDLGHSKYCRQRDLESLRYHCDYCWTSNLGCRLQSRDYSRTVL
jgi:ankyrin repeat protein